MLITASQIIERSWKFYLNNWKKLLPFMLLFGILMLLSSAFQIYNAYEAHYGFLINSGLVLFIAFFSFIILLSILSIWVSTALTRAIADLLENKPINNWKAVFHSIKPVLWPTIYTSLLAGIIIFGGTLLFIIPGIIFTVWYLFSTYAVILDDKKGRTALHFSKSLVLGRWWKILWRVLVPALLFGLLAYLIILAIILPLNWSTFSTSLSSTINTQPLSPNSSYEEYQRVLSAAAPLPNIGLIIINNIIMAIVYMFLIPLSTVAIVLLYQSAKENPVSQPSSSSFPS